MTTFGEATYYSNENDSKSYIWKPFQLFSPLLFQSCEITSACDNAIFLSLLLGSQLNAQLEGWLSQAQSSAGPARAIIAPYVK